MNLNELLAKTSYFGIIISLVTYLLGTKIKAKWNYVLISPMIISLVLIITFLLVFDIDYETYQSSAKYLDIFLTPATICLAVPLYKQWTVLKQNVTAIFVGILCGCLSHAFLIVAMTALFGVDYILQLSMLPKSVTTPVALSISTEMGGIAAVTVIGVTIAGLTGAMFAPIILKWFRIKEPLSQGLAIGTASHALGTSKAVELGEVQAAMSSLAIIITGLLTVVTVPIVIIILK